MLVVDTCTVEINFPSFAKRLRMTGANSSVLLQVDSHATVESLSYDQMVSGFLDRHASTNDLIEGIETVARGERFFCCRRLKPLNAYNSRGDVDKPKLTIRETDVLNGVLQGLSIKEIAFQIGLSLHTVRGYHKSLMKKFRVSRTVDLVLTIYNDEQMGH